MYHVQHVQRVAHIRVSRAYRASAGRLPSPVQVARTHTETSSSCLPSFTASAPKQQAHTCLPQRSLPSLSPLPTSYSYCRLQAARPLHRPWPPEHGIRSRLALARSLITVRALASALGISSVTSS